MNSNHLVRSPARRPACLLALPAWVICCVLLAGCDGDPITPPLPVNTATPWHVPGDFATIAAALDSARTGQVILLAPGVYTEHDLEIDDGITLRRDVSKAGEVVIDAQGQGRVLTISGEENTVILEGLTITHGHSATNGGGVQVGFGVIAEFRRCRFLANVADEEGGGIHSNMSNLVFSHCSFDSNSAGQAGGGVRLTRGFAVMDTCRFTGNEVNVGNEGYGGGCFSQAVVSWTGCTFANNSSTYYGGALVHFGSESTIFGCSFTGNQASGQGGACYLVWAVQVRDCVFAENSATEGGAAFCWGGADIQDCEFTGNSSSGGGGALHLVGSSPVVARCTFTDNQGGSGGAFAVLTTTTTTFNDCGFSNNTARGWGGVGNADQCQELILNNCTLIGNTSDYMAGALATHYAFEGSTLTLNDCTVTGNSAAEEMGALYLYHGNQLTAAYTTFADNTAPVWPGGFFGVDAQVLLICCDMDLEDFGGPGTVTVDNEGCEK